MRLLYETKENPIFIGDLPIFCEYRTSQCVQAGPWNNDESNRQFFHTPKPPKKVAEKWET